VRPYTSSTHRCNFKWPWTTLSNLAKFLTSRCLARPLCNSWASCLFKVFSAVGRRRHRTYNEFFIERGLINWLFLNDFEHIRQEMRTNGLNSRYMHAAKYNLVLFISRLTRQTDRLFAVDDFRLAWLDSRLYSYLLTDWLIWKPTRTNDIAFHSIQVVFASGYRYNSQKAAVYTVGYGLVHTIH